MAAYATKKTKPHENVRLQVANLVLNITKEVVREVKKGLKKEGAGLLWYALVKLEEFLDKSSAWQVIIPQEVAAGEGWVDMDLFGRIIFEFKGFEREFDDAEKQVASKYLAYFPTAMYAVITNYEKWRIYKVVKARQSLELVFSGDLEQAVKVLRNIIADVISGEGYKLPPTPAAIALLFSEISSYEQELEGALDSVLAREAGGERLITPLYESFKHIVTTIYSEADEGFIKRLFVKHTLLHMIALASVSKVFGKTASSVDMCSGSALDVEVALPYLNWWYVAYERGLLEPRHRELVERLTQEIVTRVSLIDWDVPSVEDVFRELYELLIDQETRRKIGEYYTPLWLAELIIGKVAKFAGGLRSKLVLDPFCGSGTFLVLSFYKKVSEGESPDEAISELVGFDINPLAVSIARAELLLAYRRAGGRGAPTPLVFHTDSLRPVFEGRPSGLIAPSSAASDITAYLFNARKAVLEEAFAELLKILKVENVEGVIEAPRDNLLEVVRFEKALSRALRIAAANDKCKALGDPGERARCLEPLIESHLLEALKAGALGDTAIGRLLREKMDKIVPPLSKILSHYGNGVWAVTIASLLAPYVAKAVKADVVVTNPPWLQLTKFRASYAEKVREMANSLAGDALGRKDVGNIIVGSDVASVALYVGLGMAREALGYVMPREASFHASGGMEAGLLLTYAVLKSFEESIERVEMIDLDFDAFQHGNYPSIIVVKMRQGGGAGGAPNGR